MKLPRLPNDIERAEASFGRDFTDFRKFVIGKGIHPEEVDHQLEQWRPIYIAGYLACRNRRAWRNLTVVGALGGLNLGGFINNLLSAYHLLWFAR